MGITVFMELCLLFMGFLLVIIFAMLLYQFLDKKFFNPTVTAVEILLVRGYNLKKLVSYIEQLPKVTMENHLKSSREQALWIVSEMDKDINNAKQNKE